MSDDVQKLIESDQSATEIAGDLLPEDSEQSEEVSAAVEMAQDLMGEEGMDMPTAAQAAARDFEVPFDKVYRGLQLDQEKPRDGKENDGDDYDYDM